jgi:hypothetical protein
MKHSGRFYLKRAWALFWVFIYVVYRLERGVIGDLFVPQGQGEWAFGMIFLLSFPGSLIYVLLLDNLIGSYGLFELEAEPLFWLGMLAVGYWQWCWLMPRLFEMRGITTLNLSSVSPSTVTSEDALPSADSSPPPHSTPPTTTREPLYRHFDDGGQTPLERAFATGVNEG